ncbi:MAG: endonuclease/exonuclease/phosphatase family protein [Clostridia bacterium]|nr:endonuclease/exonuclease/phosphatase family protein [Clostridia bacterium]
MKIMTFNTQHCKNYLEQKIDFQIMADVIRNSGAEVIGLNEMRGKGEDPEYDRQMEILSELTGIEYYYFAKAIDVPNMGPYGNGLLSKCPIISAETVPIPDPVPQEGFRNYETRCVLKVKLENGLTVLVTHFGLNPDEQENAVETILGILEDEKCVLMGDFNVEPDSEILRPIRACMKDTAEKFDREKLSFPSDSPEIKIDYIFATPDIEIITADIPEIVASDHRPHTAEIDF